MGALAWRDHQLSLPIWSNEMTLSLDEVRNIRFPMARKPNEDGYRASAVDNFMDKLEISYAELFEELEALLLERAFGEHGSTRKVARVLEVNQSTIVRKMKQYQITRYDA